MTEQQSLETAIKKARGDMTPVLVYCDWLDEHDLEKYQSITQALRGEGGPTLLSSWQNRYTSVSLVEYVQTWLILSRMTENLRKGTISIKQAADSIAESFNQALPTFTEFVSVMVQVPLTPAEKGLIEQQCRKTHSKKYSKKSKNNNEP